MSKLADLGILWIEDSEIYVASKELFPDHESFLHAVIAHIKALMDSCPEAECGWCELPSFEHYINQVTTSWMVHRVNYATRNSPFWELIEKPGKGHKLVWYVDFETEMLKVGGLDES